MDLTKILSVSGKGGLYKIVGQTKSGIVAESLIDKKRIPVFAADKMSSLEDIRIFTEVGDVPLKEVFKKIFDKENGGTTSTKATVSNDELKKYMEEVLPEYDKERVYVSDIKKLINWYNLLHENKLLVFEEEVAEEKTDAENDDAAEKESLDNDAQENDVDQAEDNKDK